MARNAMWSMVLGILLSATVVYAQEDPEVKKVRFEPAVQILDLEQPGVTVIKSGATTAVEGLCFKAYPYGSTFKVADGVTCSLRFSDLTKVAVTGPAELTPMASDMFSKIVLDVKRGELGFAVDTRAEAGQFTVITPIGSFTSMQGTARLMVGDIAAGTIDEDDFSFRMLSGSAVFSGLHYGMKDMTQANAYRSSEVKKVTTAGKIYQDTRLTGASGDVRTSFAMGNGQDAEFSLAPGATVKITRAKQPGSENWVVSVLTLHANGKAKNYFCYVDGRGEEYATGDLLGEVLPEDEEGEDGEEDADTSEEDMDDFEDEELL